MKCQFCGADVSMVPRPVEKEVEKQSYKMLSKGTLRGFYFVCTLQIMLGIFEFLLGMGVFGNPGDMLKTCYMVYGIVQALVGIGLVFRLPAVYAFSTGFCGIEVILGVVFIIAATMTIPIPALKWGVIVMGACQMLIAGFLFYFAEETALGTVSA